MKKTILEEILVSESVPQPKPQPESGVIVGRLVALNPEGEPLVDYPGNRSGGPLRALTTVPLRREDVGREIALLFEKGDRSRPLVIGPLLRQNQPAAEIDGERLTFTAEKEIVLSCGAASITLTRAGKILIRGKYVLSRSSGVNRIKGGSIQLN